MISSNQQERRDSLLQLWPIDELADATPAAKQRNSTHCMMDGSMNPPMNLFGSTAHLGTRRRVDFVLTDHSTFTSESTTPLSQKDHIFSQAVHTSLPSAHAVQHDLLDSVLTAVRRSAIAKRRPTPALNQLAGTNKLPISTSFRDDGAQTAPEPGYIRFEVSDFNCKALCKVVPTRHRDDEVYLYSGALGLGPKAAILTLPKEVLDAGCGNAKLIPDWNTLQTLPWAAVDGRSVQRVYCSMADLKDNSVPLPAMPRVICNRLLSDLRGYEGRGIELLAASELEFSVAEPCAPGENGQYGKWKPIFDGFDIFATLQNTKAMPLMADIERHMEQVGVDIKTMNAEYGPGQLEITFAPTWGISAADSAATFRTGVKEIAQQKGMMATFCSKPFGLEGPGNGGHFNFSLWVPDQAAGDMNSSERVAVGFDSSGMSNFLHSKDSGSAGLSEEGRHFLAGVLEHARGLEALCSPTPACYTRHGRWAPDRGDWGFDDRSACLRVKADPAGPGTACYIELRMPSSSASPYLIISGLVAAGLDGLRRKLPLRPSKSAEPKEQVDAHVLPTNLPCALAALKEDKVLVNALGEQFVRWYCTLKEAEIDWLANQKCGDVGEAWRQLYMEYV